jgi:branched-chain amino acid transport system ATP-binding protein
VSGALLDVSEIYAGYGNMEVLRSCTVTVGRGELVAVLGPNGSGKSTLLRTISRYDTTLRSGRLLFGGVDITRKRAEEVVRAGCLHVPEGRQLFTELSVEDNLRLGAYTTSRRTLTARLSEVYDRFPRLAERRQQSAFSLSGGEQQMLAIGRALICTPVLLMLDEPSTGLAPLVVEQIFQIVANLVADGTAVLLVEQNARLTMAHAHRVYVLEQGVVALSGTADELRNDPRVRAVYLGASTDEVED